MELSHDHREVSVDIESEGGIKSILNKLNIPFYLPEYLIQLLEFNGFDNLISLTMLSNEDFEKLEDFAKNDLSKLLDGEEQQKFFGLYARNISLFKIVEGHRRLIMELVKNAKSIWKINKQEI